MDKLTNDPNIVRREMGLLQENLIPLVYEKAIYDWAKESDDTTFFPLFSRAHDNFTWDDDQPPMVDGYCSLHDKMYHCERVALLLNFAIAQSVKFVRDNDILLMAQYPELEICDDGIQKLYLVFEVRATSAQAAEELKVLLALSI